MDALVPVELNQRTRHLSRRDGQGEKQEDAVCQRFARAGETEIGFRGQFIFFG